MDYKYIEQLLERYWKCDTTQEEEQILRTFFRQKSVPEKLRKYRDLFASCEQMREDEVLGDDFDTRILSMIDGEETVKARTITMRQRLMPLFKAAAVVAIVVTLGNAAQLSLGKGGDSCDDEINYTGYKDTFNDPSVAYDRVHNALELVSEGFSMAQLTDSVRGVKSVNGNDSIR